MGDFYPDLVAYVKETVKSTPKGAETPDDVCESIIWNFIYESFRDQYFMTEKFARWFEGEFGFTPDQVEGIIGRMGEMASEVGFVVVMPGELPPEENAPDQPPVEEQYEAQTAACEETPVEEPPNYIHIGQTLSDSEAANLLNALVSGGMGIEPAVAGVLREKVLPTEYVVTQFLPIAGDGAESSAIRRALCLHAAMEIDYMHYTGARKIPGFSLSTAVNYTKRLIGRYEDIKKSLDDLKSGLENAGRKDAIGEIECLKGRMDSISNDLGNLVATFSGDTDETAPVPSPTAPSEKKSETPRRTPVAASKSARKMEESANKRKNIIQVVVSFAIIVLIVAGVGTYLYKKFAPPPQRVFDVSKYSAILTLKKAEQVGPTFSAVIDSKVWGALSKEEKTDRAERLLTAAKYDEVDSIVLLDEKGNLLVQTYGGKPKIIK